MQTVLDIYIYMYNLIKKICFKLSDKWQIKNRTDPGTAHKLVGLNSKVAPTVTEEKLNTFAYNYIETKQKTIWSVFIYSVTYANKKSACAYHDMQHIVGDVRVCVSGLFPQYMYHKSQLFKSGAT